MIDAQEERVYISADFLVPNCCVPKIQLELPREASALP
jgi:hypothetical protein